MKNNVIPRKFYSITAQMLIETSHTKPNDIIKVYKNDFGYLASNRINGNYFYIFSSMLRNSEICKIIDIDK